MRTIAIVVLYNDNTIEVANNISMIAKQVDKVCLVDNSDVAYPERFSRIANAIYISTTLHPATRTTRTECEGSDIHHEFHFPLSYPALSGSWHDGRSALH